MSSIAFKMLTRTVALLVFTVLIGQNGGEAAKPIVIWHGMGDSCCFSFSVGGFMKYLRGEIDGLYVTSLMIGDSIIQDVLNGLLLTPEKQIEIACDLIRNDPQLQGGFNGIAFSQGSQLLRGTLEKCGHTIPPMHNLITLGGQHQGVYGVPNCNPKVELCDVLRKKLSEVAYSDKLQNSSTQATFWHDPLNEEVYREKSTFIADINNERVINQTYIDNLQSLNKFVMVRFNQDSTVIPLSSSYFGFYAPGQSEIEIPMEETPVYVEDKLGLQQMVKNDQIDFIGVDGEHVQFSHEWFSEYILEPYLR